MKKTLYLFGATTLASTMLFSCSKDEAKPKNYYGVEPVDSDRTPKEAYYAFTAGVFLIVIFVVWLLKKMKNNK